jgi:hypothetical protein
LLDDDAPGDPAFGLDVILGHVRKALAISTRRAWPPVSWLGC